MKFGRNLPQSQVPEWAASYIDYKGLKKLIKTEAERSDERAGAQPDTAAFFYSLDRNLEDIDAFYNKKFADCSRRLKLLQDQYGRSQQDSTILDRDEVEDLTSALLDLRSALRKLQWYGEVNRRGFVKITKKLDKRLGFPKGATQKPYNEAKVDLRPFAKDGPLLDLTLIVNDWLSKLGEVNSDEERASRPTFSLSRVPSRNKSNLPEGTGEKVDEAVCSDDAKGLALCLAEAPREPTSSAYHRLILTLLSRAIGKRAEACIAYLLGLVDDLEDADDINQRNCIHRYLVSLNRTQLNESSLASSGITPNETRLVSQYITPAAPPIVSSPYPTKERDDSDLSGFAEAAAKLLKHLLDSLKPVQRKALVAKDNLGRIPLHLSAQFGFAALSEIIVAKMKEWALFEVDLGIHAPWLRDTEGLTPIHLAVLGGHPLTTQILLTSLKGASLRSEFIRDPQIGQKLAECLAQAVKAGYLDIVLQLLLAKANVNLQDTQGESAVHIAARLGQTAPLALLLSDSAHPKADLELCETTFEWTPLFMACKEGHIEAVELLLQASADATRVDPGGWTAQEHAALRGHLKIAQLLNDHIKLGPPTTQGLGSASMEPVHRPKKKKEKREAVNGQTTTVQTEAVKTFGHRYLTNKSMILVSLGTMNIRSTLPAVELKQIPVAEAHRTQLDTALSVVITADGAEGEPEVVDLPIQDNISTDPFTFMTANVSETTLQFDLVPTYAGSADKIIGRASAMLSSVKPNVGTKRMPLRGDVCVPIHSAHTLKVIGSVNFTYLVITPFSHPKISLSERSTFWKKTTQAMVIGHRGLGKNMTSRKALQLGENTIQSFISAANLGAAYVEFDVQLTKDHVPVIYHDFLVSETGIDAPVHTLTLEQFLHINPENPNSPQLNPTNGDSDKESNDSHSRTRRGRAYSWGTDSLLGIESNRMDERMKHTRDFKSKGFKANSRGKFIQEPFTTLEKMFRTLPKELSFNIEMKYPMLWESEQQEMDPYAVDLNVFVDTVLKMVYDLGSGREIIFSSFNPDVCLLLAFKQPSIPVLFLTDAGASEVGDVRASSLKEAIRFASRWDLLGIVSQASPFVLSPRLISIVKENGLMCVSYGTQNNDADNVQLQEDEGIDAVITDDLLQIKKARLTKTSGGVTAMANSTAAVSA